MCSYYFDCTVTSIWGIAVAMCYCVGMVMYCIITIDNYVNRVLTNSHRRSQKKQLSESQLNKA